MPVEYLHVQRFPGSIALSRRKSTLSAIARIYHNHLIMKDNAALR
tara:strand:+ start:1853 stop:1987 length:135 start_codon:yes stop_codon:yes gene_type:complete